MRRYGSLFDCPRMAILFRSVIPGKGANYKMQTEVKCINKKKCTIGTVPGAGFDY